MVFILFVFGLLTGSFLNVLILRTHSNKSFVTGRSECLKCHKKLVWYELIPVLSYVLQKGKCRKCGKTISAQYPMVELGTAAMFALLYAKFGSNVTSLGRITLVFWLVIASLLMASFVYDLRWMLLPDRFMIPAIVLAVGYLLLANSYFGQPVLAARAVGALVFALFFGALWFFSKGTWIGDGDIRLAFLMGLLLSPQQLVVAIFFSFNIAAITALALLGLRLKNRKDVIPLGPFLILGTFIGLFLGEALINMYLGV